MKGVRVMTAVLAATAATMAVIAAADGVSLEDVLARHLEAIGGGAALHAVDALRIHLLIDEAGSRAEATYVAERRLHMRIDVMRNGKRVLTEGYDGSRGWQLASNGSVPTDSNTEGSAALRRGLLAADRFFSLQELAHDYGGQLTLAQPQTLDRVNFYVIHKVLDGAAEDLFLDPRTWLIVRTREVAALHPDREPRVATIETVYSDFRQVGGVVRPFREVRRDLASGIVLQIQTIVSVETNPSLDNRAFEKPG